MAISAPGLGTPSARSPFENTPEEKRRTGITVVCRRIGPSREAQLADVRNLLEMLGLVEPKGPERPPANGLCPAHLARRSPRHKPRPIVALHADGTTCHHRVTTTGGPIEPDCTGRERYSSRCDCGWSIKSPTRALVKAERTTHRLNAGPAEDKGGDA
jgi:hypothetical protein